jgi:hypothetical protein
MQIYHVTSLFCLWKLIRFKRQDTPGFKDWKLEAIDRVFSAWCRNALTSEALQYCYFLEGISAGRGLGGCQALMLLLISTTLSWKAILKSQSHVLQYAVHGVVSFYDCSWFASNSSHVLRMMIDPWCVDATGPLWVCGINAYTLSSRVESPNIPSTT